MKIVWSKIVPVALAIFSMLFGAGNLIYPLIVGRDAGSLTWLGMIAFLLTSVFLPIAGLVAMILFDGDYASFFKRLGSIPGHFFIFCCMMIIGPVVVVPRIVTLSHTMIAPFIPITLLQTITPLSSFIFAISFLTITFFAAFRENKIVDVLGKYIGPTLFISLVIIIAKGIIFGETISTTDASAFTIFKINFIRGYETLDLLATIFFASIIITILKQTMYKDLTHKDLVKIGARAGFLGVSLLGLVYIGMSILGMYYGTGFESLNAGSLFREISFQILGSQGALLIGTAVLSACLSTSIAVNTVVAEYIQNIILKNNISFVIALLCTLAAAIPLSIFGLDAVLSLTAGPIVYIGYPTLIMLTFCNIAYKLFDFKHVKIPVLVTFIISIVSFYW